MLNRVLVAELLVLMVLVLVLVVLVLLVLVLVLLEVRVRHEMPLSVLGVRLGGILEEGRRHRLRGHDGFHFHNVCRIGDFSL